MKEVKLDRIPRRLDYYVTTHLEPGDQNTYWRLCLHVRHFINGYRAHRITFVLSVIALVTAALVADTIGPVVDVGIVALLLNFSTYKYFSFHRDAADKIYAKDPAKWRAIGEVAKPICDEHKPGDPEVTVTVYLPDS